ncbi:hypothetical protein BDR04DRAFT_1144820 [Suillus decipiens]|nr:hypothetical protein BDR04DRAFT_1144820 [Suillus decipiens]
MHSKANILLTGVSGGPRGQTQVQAMKIIRKTLHDDGMLGPLKLEQCVSFCEDQIPPHPHFRTLEKTLSVPRVTSTASPWCTHTTAHQRYKVRRPVNVTTDLVANADTNNPASRLSKVYMRAASSENITLVHGYIASNLKVLDWHVEEDTFIDNTL